MSRPRTTSGARPVDDLQHMHPRGISIGEAMRSSGLDPDAIGGAARPPSAVKAHVELHVELHVEQGKILENKDLPVGIVTGIAGPLWLRFVLEGEAGHAGTTPMAVRRDALAAAAETIQALETGAARTGRRG